MANRYIVHPPHNHLHPPTTFQNHRKATRMTISLKIKNAGKVYDIEIEESATGADFKQQIFEKTRIPAARQKVVMKGGKLTDDAIISTFKINSKIPIMVLGSPDEDAIVPVARPVFIEDLNQDQLVVVSQDPSGLMNLGNTCYLNSSLQALFQVKDLASKVEEASQSQDALVRSLSTTFKSMSKRQENINPAMLLLQLRKRFPQFAEQTHGMYSQQDAEEAYSQLLRVLAEELDLSDLFTVGYKTKTKCLAGVDDEVKESSEAELKLNCHIDINTNFLRDGILKSLKDTFEKHNDTLGCNATYETTRTITRLPKYLTVHFMRFFWRDDTKLKSKILRKVQFPFELDLAEMLDDSVKKDKIEIRDKLHKIEKDNEELIRDFKKAKKDTSMTPQQIQEEDELKVASIKSKFQDDFADILPDNFLLGSATENPSSVYDLTAIITHQGISADLGHYQAFVRDEKSLDGDLWWKFNDNKVSTTNREKIEMLAGGGEADSALILMYKAKGM